MRGEVCEGGARGVFLKVSTILDQIDLGSMALPEFQRGYVWNRDQVRGLMQSLYRKYPVGGLLVWVTGADSNTRGEQQASANSVKLLLDGQQRVTTLYGIIRGDPPAFFDGNPATFTGLYFHLDDEIFEFYRPMKMEGNPYWVSVTELMRKGAGEAIGELADDPELRNSLKAYSARLNAVDSIKEIDLHVEEVTGEDKTVDVVVDIFNRVNSGGTKLSKGDLALARICAAWPQARAELRERLQKWRGAGFDFKMDWFLRNINTILTGEAFFSALRDVDTSTFKEGLGRAERSVDSLLNLISARLGLDHDRVLGGRYAFPVMSRYLDRNGGRLDYAERDKLLYWYVHTFLWGRYTGSTETFINQDLAAIESSEQPLDRLIELLRQSRGSLEIDSTDFAGWSLGARFYPLLYLLTRTWGALDWGSGVALSNNMLGRGSSLHLHHIFPKAYLYEIGYERPQVNALANFAFLTMDTNLDLGKRPPQDYFEEISERHPGALESQWIPMDRDLWRAENYGEFLEARREMLARAANQFLQSLLHGEVPESATEPEPEGIVAARAAYLQDEEEQIIECMEWAIERGLPEPELEYPLIDESTGEQSAALDMAWPDGLQPGLSEPVAVLIDEPREVEDAARKEGYRFFRSIEEFKQYVNKENLTEEVA